MDPFLRPLPLRYILLRITALTCISWSVILHIWICVIFVFAWKYEHTNTQDISIEHRCFPSFLLMQYMVEPSEFIYFMGMLRCDWTLKTNIRQSQRPTGIDFCVNVRGHTMLYEFIPLDWRLLLTPVYTQTNALTHRSVCCTSCVAQVLLYIHGLVVFGYVKYKCFTTVELFRTTIKMFI